MRIALGVLAGLVLSAALMIGSNVLLVQHAPPTSTLFIATTLIFAVVFHLFGGYICAVIARDAFAATLALVVLGELLLLTSVVQTWHQMPVWYSLAMLVIVPASLWQGAQLHHPARAAPA